MISSPRGRAQTFPVLLFVTYCRSVKTGTAEIKYLISGYSIGNGRAWLARLGGERVYVNRQMVFRQSKTIGLAK